MKLKNKILLLFLAFMFIGLFLTSKVFATDTINIMVKGTEEYTRAKEVLDLVNKERNANNHNIVLVPILFLQILFYQYHNFFQLILFQIIVIDL